VIAELPVEAEPLGGLVIDTKEPGPVLTVRRMAHAPRPALGKRWLTREQLSRSGRQEVFAKAVSALLPGKLAPRLRCGRIERGVE
jgi:hypothetical protein